MQNIIQWLALLISTAITYSLQGTIILLVFNKKINWKRLALFALINALAREIPIQVPATYLMFIYTVMYFITMIATLKLILKIGFLHSILATGILVLISGLIEYISMALFKLIFQNKFDLSIWILSCINISIMRNTANLFWFIAVMLILYFKMKINIPEDISKKRTFGLVINGLVISVIIIPNTLFLSYTIIKIPMELIIFNAISVILLLSVSIYNTINFGELEIKRQEVEFQKLYIQTLNNTIDGLRGFKHDFNNIIQVISGYISLDDLSGLRKYFSQLQGDCRTINNILPLNTYIKDNPAVYGLLLSKISDSEVKDIIFNVNITTKINISNIKAYDFCKVLGILLDNALEAAAESEKRYAELMIMEKPGKTGLVIEITNSFSGHVDIEKIYGNGYTTKDNHTGFGLWEVKKILSRYKNCSLKTSTADNIFQQLIEILY